MDKLEYSGQTSSYTHKWNPDKPNDPKTKSGLRKVWFLDAQWSTCPIEVENEVKMLWRDCDLGNDDYMLKRSVEDLLEWGDKTKYLVQYIREHGIPDDEEVVIHWWW